VDEVFRALADPNRRHLLDSLYREDGQTLGQLAGELDMTRFGVMKHLRILEEAHLVVTRKRGREKLHYLNPVPIQSLYDRWVDKYRRRTSRALTDLKRELEEA
jgi:DNA-binding transcriptional ArsR family regulator